MLTVDLFSMKPRKYDKYIEIWATIEEEDGYGGFINTDSKLFSLWANIEIKRSIVKTDNGDIQNLNGLIFNIRNRVNFNVNPKTNYLKYNSLVYNIDSISNVDLNNIEIQLYVSQRN
mgnify:CR=1 FL=1